MPALQSYPDQNRIVTALAAQFEAPVAAVAALYENELAVLAAGASVTQFIHIFATRHVADILRERELAQAAMAFDSRDLHVA